MTTINSRFGQLSYDPDSTMVFPEGLIGFEKLRHFVVMPQAKDGPLFWIQSCEREDIAFLLTDPSQFFPTYTVKPAQNERKRLAVESTDDCFILAVVSVRSARDITLNLAAPLLFAPKTRRALQTILEGSTYQTRTPLPTPENT